MVKATLDSRQDDTISATFAQLRVRLGDLDDDDTARKPSMAELDLVDAIFRSQPDFLGRTLGFDIASPGAQKLRDGVLKMIDQEWRNFTPREIAEHRRCAARTRDLSARERA